MEIHDCAVRRRSRFGAMARAFALAAVLALVAGFAVGCSNGAQQTGAEEGASGQAADASSANEAAVSVRVGALKGPTGMGLAKMMADVEAGENEDAGDYAFTLSGSADELTPALVKGDLDICMVPANLAAVLYANTDGAVQVLAVNTLGVLDIVSVGDGVQGMADLKGKTIVAAGKGSTPEYALRYLLESNGLDPDVDVTIEWKSEHAECVAALAENPAAVAMLPQPFATSAMAKIEGARIALDLNDVWNEAMRATGGDSALITGVVVARTAFVEEHPQAVADFMATYEASIAYTGENAAEAAQLICDAGIIDAAVAEKALPYCNIVFWSGDAMKTALSGYLQTLYDANPKAVGGALPGDDFYYLP